jgi:hypothetical protein
MKLTNDLVNLFESDQKNYGTKTAMWNLLYLNADDQLRDLGVKRLRNTTYPDHPRRKKVKK